MANIWKEAWSWHSSFHTTCFSKDVSLACFHDVTKPFMKVEQLTCFTTTEKSDIQSEGGTRFVDGLTVRTGNGCQWRCDLKPRHRLSVARQVANKVRFISSVIVQSPSHSLAQAEYDIFTACWTRGVRQTAIPFSLRWFIPLFFHFFHLSYEIKNLAVLNYTDVACGLWRLASSARVYRRVLSRLLLRNFVQRQWRQFELRFQWIYASDALQGETYESCR